MRLFWFFAFVACSASVKPSPIPSPPPPIDAAPIAPIDAVALAPDAAPEVEPDPTEPVAKLPAVTVVAFKPPLGKPRVVRFAIHAWSGWAPLVYANEGHAPKKVWKDPRGGEFLLELLLVDSPAVMTSALAAGDLHIGWASADMLPLLAERLTGDARPRVFQLVDWSQGGDGILVRGTIKQVSDLRGKTIVLAHHSPSHYFLLDTLRDAGVQPNEVNLRFTKDAFQAAATFNQTPRIDAIVAWAPDLQFLARVPGNQLLITTALASRAIAHVWFARADFAKANPGIIEALVRRNLDAATELQTDANKATAAKLMETLLSYPAGTVKITEDAQLANHAHNRDFLLDRKHPTNFQRIYDNAASLYTDLKLIDQRIAFDQLVDASIIKKLGAEAKYARQAAAPPRFVSLTSVDLARTVLTKTVTINFFPNSSDVFKPAPDNPSAYYDPNVERTIADIAQLAHKFGAARLHIGGFTDSSMKGVADEELVRALSEQRATAVKDALVKKHKLDPARLVAEGFGWDRPVDPQDPDNHAKNRRVEIRVLPAAP